MYAMGEMGAGTSDSPREETIVDRLRRRFHDSMYVSLRGIECEFENGVLTLHGALPRYYVKQVMLSLMEDMEGVERIEDRVEVSW